MQAGLKHGAAGLRGAPLQPPSGNISSTFARLWWTCSLSKDSPTSSELDTGSRKGDNLRFINMLTLLWAGDRREGDGDGKKSEKLLQTQLKHNDHKLNKFHRSEEESWQIWIFTEALRKNPNFGANRWASDQCLHYSLFQMETCTVVSAAGYLIICSTLECNVSLSTEEILTNCLNPLSFCGKVQNTH